MNSCLFPGPEACARSGVAPCWRWRRPCWSPVVVAVAVAVVVVAVAPQPHQRDDQWQGHLPARAVLDQCESRAELCQHRGTADTRGDRRTDPVGRQHACDDHDRQQWQLRAHGAREHQRVRTCAGAVAQDDDSGAQHSCAQQHQRQRAVCARQCGFQFRGDEPDEEPARRFGLGRHELHRHPQRGPVRDPRHAAGGGGIRRRERQFDARPAGARCVLESAE